MKSKAREIRIDATQPTKYRTVEINYVGVEYFIMCDDGAISKVVSMEERARYDVVDNDEDDVCSR